jgi:c-di-GMP-binding flagellar brake protein YcgR
MLVQGPKQYSVEASAMSTMRPQILGMPPGDGTCGGVERRAFVRYACKGPIAFQPLEPDQTSWLAEIMDISAGGVGMRISSSLAIGAVLALELEIIGEARTIPARVVYCRPTETGDYWLVGCEFIDVRLSEWELGRVVERSW